MNYVEIQCKCHELGIGKCHELGIEIEKCHELSTEIQCKCHEDSV